MTELQSILESAAITVVFTRGTIFKIVRESGPALWRQLASCALCSGVWIGAAWKVAFHGTTSVSWQFALEVLGAGALTGVVALWTSLLLDILDKHA